MSIATLYGIQPFEIRPSHDFRVSIDKTGKATGSQTFHCRKFDYSSAQIQDRIRRGKPITDLYPEIGAAYNFLEITDVEHEHQAGGFTRIIINFEGFPVGFEWDYQDDAEGSYSVNAALSEIDICLHPVFTKLLNETPYFEKDGIIGIVRGRYQQSWQATSDPSKKYFITDLNQNHYTEVVSVLGKRIFDKVVIDGARTYQAPTIEFTQTKTNRGGVGELSKLGLIDTPPGPAPTFTGRNWMLTGATESRTRGGGDQTTTWTKTWQLSAPFTQWDSDFYGPLPTQATIPT
jgi:hypothetical protein